MGEEALQRSQTGPFTVISACIITHNTRIQLKSHYILTQKEQKDGKYFFFFGFILLAMTWA